MEKYNDYKIHIAKKGDSTQSICAQYSVSENDLVKANPGIDLAPFGGGFFSAPKFRLDIKQGDHVRIPFHNTDKDKKGVKTIRGKKSVKVGVWENYEVTEWYEGTPKEERNPSKVKWDLYLMKNGTKPELVLQKEEGKIRFQEKAIGNKYKVVGYLHQPELNSGSAVLVNVEAAEKREILSIKISDINNKPVKDPIAYGQTINVHIETTGMKGEYLYVSLWEDDANGEGHSDTNKHNLVAEGKVLVGNKGVAHKQFVLKADFKKIANAYLSKGDSSEGSTHEYYVTAYASGESKVSKNINVRNPDYQEKRKEETSQHIEGKGQPQKTNTPPYKAKAGTTQPTQTKGISKVTLTKNGSKQLLATIYSKGLMGKKVRFQVLEHDNSGSDQLVDQTHTLNNDVYKIDIFLDRIDQSKGGGFWSEGYEQELYVDVEVLETHTHIESQKVNVDINAFKVETAETTTVAKVGDSKVEPPKGNSCEQKFCIKKGDKSELIREINIRLAGFGGNVPTDEFTDRTEKMIKQFQKDYMKVPETGKVCGNVLLAIDDFSRKFDISTNFWNQLKCSCSTKGKQATSKLRGTKELNSCAGFGDATGKGTYGGNDKSEKFHRYEYPGIHRSLLFGIKALQFYFSKQTTYKIDQITSGYRCRFKNYTTTNHQGKAIDIQFSKGDWQIRGEQKKNLDPLRDIRDSLYVKYLGAQKEWPNKNLFSIEPIDLLYDKKGNVRYDHTFSWIHVDVREFDSAYLDDKYFCKNVTALNGKSIIQLARESGYENTCSCMAPKAVVEPPKKEIKSGCYCKKDLTVQILKDIGITDAKANEFLQAINKTFTDYEINTCLRKAHFLSQAIHESGGFRYTAELNVADTEYGGFKGRGLFQLTGEDNYTKYGAYENQDFTSSLKNKMKIEDLPYSVRSAGWFWKEDKDLSDESDANDFIYITRIINGGYNGYNDRFKYLKKGFEKLYDNCENDTGKTTVYEFSKSKSYNDKRGSFAWGLWHDPDLNKDGCTKDKQKAIEGYTRFIDLVDENYSETNWYNIKGLSSFSNLKYKIGKKEYVKVLAAAKQRLKALKG